jgi:UDP-2,4-diacetamido-2,4,6-trideoxy-beta-L-altropyranose hydrolase
MFKLALFRFEANFSIGAGHAIRSCVIADELVERGWSCKIITTQKTYDFIPALSRFERINPDDEVRQKADLLVVDYYGLDHDYESKMRKYARKIMVIDDLANRQHDCDILLDQTYGRAADDYKTLVPGHCEILTGIDYVLLRKEIRQMRDKALEKRRSTTKVERILVSLGGSDPQNYSLKALEMIVKSEFQGKIDVVLGFTSTNREALEAYTLEHKLDVTFHVNADMAQLMYDADLCIGAAGSSVWERLYLGLPQVLIQTADNQALILRNLVSAKNFGVYVDINMELLRKISKVHPIELSLDLWEKLYVE